jgi:hypothetical protein
MPGCTNVICRPLDFSQEGDAVPKTISEIFKDLDLKKVAIGADGKPKVDGKDLIELLAEHGHTVPQEMLNAASNWNACNANGCAPV